MDQPPPITYADDPEAAGNLDRTAANSMTTGELDEKKKIVAVEVNDAWSTDDLPEGGRQAWLTIFGAFLVQFTTFGYINAFGVYQDFYVREYLSAFSPSSIGWIGGMQVFLTFSTGIFAGPAFDRGYFRHLLVAGTILHSLSLFMLSLSHKNSYYQVFLTNGVALGLSSGLTYIACFSIPTHYFKQRRALVIGITSSGSALGAVIHPIVLNQLFKSSIGFHNGVRISAGINTFLMICANLTMRTRLPPKKFERFPVVEWLRKPDYLVFVVASWFIFLGLFFPVFYIQLSAITNGIDPDLAFYLLSILNGASMFGRVIPGHFVPRFGAYNLLIFGVSSTGILILFMVLLKSIAGFVIFAILYGFFSGQGIALLPAVGVKLSKHPNEFGSRMGIVFIVSGLLGLFSVPITGALITKQYHWLDAGLFSGIFILIAGFALALSRYFYAKSKGLKTLIM